MKKLDKFRTTKTTVLFTVVFSIGYIFVSFLVSYNIYKYFEQTIKNEILYWVKYTVYIWDFVLVLIYLWILKKILVIHHSWIKNINKGQHGKRHFEARENLDKTYNKVPAKGNFDEVPGIVIAWDKKSKDKYIYVDKSPTHNLIIGTTRSGKGETFVLPTLDIYSRAYTFDEKEIEINIDLEDMLYSFFETQLELLENSYWEFQKIQEKINENTNFINEKINLSAISIDTLNHSDYSKISDLEKEQKIVICKCKSIISAMSYKIDEIEIKKILNQTTHTDFINEIKNIIIIKAPEQIKELINNQIKNQELLRNIILEDLRLLLKNRIIRDNIYDSFDDGNPKLKARCTYEDIGKTKNVNQPSLVINDPKGELCEMMYDKFSERGYEIKILNVLDPACSHAYNPLQAPLNYYLNGDEDKAQTLVGTLANQIFPTGTGDGATWQRAAQNLFSAVVLALLEDCAHICPEKVTIYNAFNFLQELGGDKDENDESLLDKYFENKEFGSKSKTLYGSTKLSTGNTLSSILMNTANSLGVFVGDKVARMMSLNEIDIDKLGFGDKPVAVFMIVPDFDDSLHTIPSLFISQVYFTLSEKLSQTNSKELPRKVVFMLDEAGNMPAIVNMGSMITVGAGRGLLFNIILQDYEQLNAKYEGVAETIKGNCANQIYIMSNSEETLDIFSKKIGNKTVKEVTKQGKILEEKSFSMSLREKPVMSPDELKQLKFGESIVVRPLMRQDKNYNDIESVPISNLGDDRLIPRFEYMNLVDTNTVYDVLCKNKIHVKHKELNLKDNMYLPLKTSKNGKNYVIKDKHIEIQLEKQKVLIENIKETYNNYIQNQKAFTNVEIVNSLNSTYKKGEGHSEYKKQLSVVKELKMLMEKYKLTKSRFTDLYEKCCKCIELEDELIKGMTKGNCV